MASDILDNTPTNVISRIYHRQGAGEWAHAAEMLATHAIELFDRLTAAELAALFAPFPASLVEQLPDLWFVAGLVHTRLHDDVATAYAWLQKAATHYATQDLQIDRAAWAFLELARLDYARDEFARVQHFIDRAAALMKRDSAHAPAYTAFLDYMIASLCGDTGRVVEGFEYAQRAAHLYHLQHNPAREFRALLTVCSFAQQLGRYPAALDALSRAHLCYETGRLESASFEALLNAETHLAWYRGHLEAALAGAQTWVRFSQGGGFRRQRLYAHWIMGNILRALERYPQAQDYYAQARRIAAEHTSNFTRWIDAQESWLAVLQGDYTAAETLIHRALAVADEGQQMSFQVNLGVLELLTGRWEDAEPRLRASFAFYTRSQDRQATCALTFHLAYLQIERGTRTAAIVKLLRPELKWLESTDRAFFPLWWHPTIVGRVAALLLGTLEFHALGRRFFREGYLGAAGDEVLRQMYLHVPLVQRAEISELLAAHGIVAPTLADARAEAEQVIAAAIEQEQIEPAQLTSLMARLRTAQQRQRNNTTIVAVFLLHLQGLGTADIALRLNVTRSAVSHTLQIIYEVFGVSREVGCRLEQRAALQQTAREQGVIC
jgi:tetratricopeptide (TPR) repeat protein